VVPSFFHCPYLDAQVELTDEREQHILEGHSDLLPQHLDLLRQTLLEPDTIHRSPRRFDTLLFSRWYDELYGGKHVLVVVAIQESNGARHWIVTAHILRKAVPGEALWRPD
jgi:hypothetical protein